MLDNLTQAFGDKAFNINDDDRVVALMSKQLGETSIKDIEMQAMGYIVGREFMHHGEDIRLKSEQDRVLMVMPRYVNAEEIADEMGSKHIGCEIMMGKDVGGGVAHNVHFVSPDLQAQGMLPA